MRLIVDGNTCPNTIIDFCDLVTQETGIETVHIRSRIKDLYKQSSASFEDEIEKRTGLKALEPILQLLEPGDLLITADSDLAEQAIGKVTAVIDPQGNVFTPERIDMLTINEYLARLQGRYETTAKPLKHRNKEDDESFRQTLFQYIGNISI